MRKPSLLEEVINYTFSNQRQSLGYAICTRIGHWAVRNQLYLGLSTGIVSLLNRKVSREVSNLLLKLVHTPYDISKSEPPICYDNGA